MLMEIDPRPAPLPKPRRPMGQVWSSPLYSLSAPLNSVIVKGRCDGRDEGERRHGMHGRRHFLAALAIMPGL
jgi:hypothetical protein